MNYRSCTQGAYLLLLVNYQGNTTAEQPLRGNNILEGTPVLLRFLLVFLLLITMVLSLNAQEWDSQRYIGIDEIRPGMEAYCLTCFSGTTIERFALEVISVMHNIEPGRDAILVQGIDPRFVHTGPVAGCSGSPVYIDSRLAGALAFGWPLSKDPLYGVTPIREMLEIGNYSHSQEHLNDSAGNGTGAGLASWDYSQPIDFSQFVPHVEATTPEDRPGQTPKRRLDCPVMVSGLNDQAQPYLDEVFQGYGLMAVAGSGQGAGVAAISLVPGASLMIPLVDGDIQMAVVGTVTEAVGDKIYGLGHSFLGEGPVDLPLATGHIHTIVSNLSKSFKLGSPLEVVGHLVDDDTSGVVGIIGEKAPTMPLTLSIDHFRRSNRDVFDCRMARHKILQANLIKAVVGGAVMSYGSLPLDHTVEYEVTLDLANQSKLYFANLAANTALQEVLSEVLGVQALLQFNPYAKVDIESIAIDLRIVARNRTSYIASIALQDEDVLPGETVHIEAVLETYRSAKQRHTFTIEVPSDISPGTYRLTVCGPYAYQQYLRRHAAHKLMARDVPSLLTALDYALSIQRGRLYCVMDLPSSGVTLAGTELPHLPATRALVLKGTKKTVDLAPYRPWIEQSIRVGTVTSNQQTVEIKVLPRHGS
ncbi:hypothetical protein ACFL6U_14830 [Planctomycetota bacterium]